MWPRKPAGPGGLGSPTHLSGPEPCSGVSCVSAPRGLCRGPGRGLAWCSVPSRESASCTGLESQQLCSALLSKQVSRADCAGRALGGGIHPELGAGNGTPVRGGLPLCLPLPTLPPNSAEVK